MGVLILTNNQVFAAAALIATGLVVYIAPAIDRVISAPEKPFQFKTSVCTVDLEMPNFCAAARTVVRFSMMY